MENKKDNPLSINNKNDELIPIIQEWTNDHEDILIEWADKAMCYKWLHSKAHILFSNQNYAYTIPVIIISTLTGTANFAQDRVPEDYKSMFIMIVGGFNILAGIITTIQQFLKITQLTEAHRVSSIGWDKFYRNIKVEIAKPPEERINVDQMLKMCKEEFDRLIETSPVISDSVIEQFKKEFSNKLEYKEIIKPEICGQMISTENFRNQWSNVDNITKKKNIKLQKINKIKNLIINFSKEFYQINTRYPTENEYLDNLYDIVCNQVELVELKNMIKDINKDFSNDTDLQLPL
jgi:hypothetical protein